MTLTAFDGTKAAGAQRFLKFQPQAGERLASCGSLGLPSLGGTLTPTLKRGHFRSTGQTTARAV